MWKSSTINNMADRPEAWLRGSIQGVHPLCAPILYSFQQASEDLERYTAGLTAEQIWSRPAGIASAGFHMRHVAGSTDRLMTYLRGGALSAAQLAALEAEGRPGTAGRDELLAELDRVFREAEAVVRTLDPLSLPEQRTVGRKKLPTTVIGLLTHIAEHTQRHVGQAICVIQVVRAGLR
jgi:uncharacterized damage-inducible protein DinB